MPLYDLKCLECEYITERLFPKITEFLEYKDLTKKERSELRRIKYGIHPGYELIYCGNARFRNQVCKCGGFQELVAPLTNMQPDNMWAGTDTRLGYFTSKSKYEQTLKDRNLVSVDKKELDTVRKNVYNTKQDNKRKQVKATNDFLNQQLASVEISPDGNTLKERNKYARKRKQ
jgi:hypothetical protein